MANDDRATNDKVTVWEIPNHPKMNQIIAATIIERVNA